MLKTAEVIQDFSPSITVVTPKGHLSVWAFAVFALLISAGFFWEGRNAHYSSLSSDQLTLLAMSAKKDYPQLFKGDLVIGDERNVAYYIPVFIDLIRIASRPNHDYLRGLNILLFATSLIYMWGWWMLFSAWTDRWLAAVLAFLARGVMWPPGNELWGIAGLWSILPRTLFLALLAWVMCLWFRGRKTRTGWWWCCLLSGLITNVHPISGVCCIGAMLVAEAAWTYSDSKNLFTSFRRVMLGGLLALLGMMPFVWNFWASLGSAQGINRAELDLALRMRIGPTFWDPFLYLKEWLRPSLFAFVTIPWLVCLFVPRRQLARHKKTLMALGVFALTCVAIALLPFPIEKLLNSLGFQSRFAFQFVRDGKYVMLSSVVVSGLVGIMLAEHFARRYRNGRKVVVVLCCLLLVLTIFARRPVFDGVPAFGDDIARMLWPKLEPSSNEQPVSNSNMDANLDGVFSFIREHTAEDAKFVGPRAIRFMTLRAIVHDFGSAVVLVEGNPRAFVAAAERERQLRTKEYQDPAKRGQLFANWGADYWVTQAPAPELSVAYADSGWFVYDLRGNRVAP